MAKNGNDIYYATTRKLRKTVSYDPEDRWSAAQSRP